MATDIPPHNLSGGRRRLHLISRGARGDHARPHETREGAGPAHGGEIISPRADLKEFYEKGVGTFKARATWEIEEGNVIITAFPYQVSPTRVQEQIAEQMRAKKLPMVDDLRDESDHENPTRLVLVPRSNRIDTPSS